MKTKINVELKVLDPRLREWGLPEMATAGSAAFDLRAACEGPLWIQPGHSITVPTGIAVHIHDDSVAMVLIPRSGQGSNGLVLGNLTGLVDSDFQGVVRVCLWNRKNDRAIRVDPGDRIAQAMLVPVYEPDFHLVEEFSRETDRGTGGFGSTGSK